MFPSTSPYTKFCAGDPKDFSASLKSSNSMGSLLTAVRAPSMMTFPKIG
jgi:hypothetical protein